MDLEKIVELGKMHKEMTGDHKTWIDEDTMRALVLAGALVIVNRKETNGNHLTEVFFRGLHFINVSLLPLIPTVLSSSIQ